MESTELRQSFSIPEAGKAIAMTLLVIYVRSRLQPNSLNLFFGPPTISLRKSIIIIIKKIVCLNSIQLLIFEHDLNDLQKQKVQQYRATESNSTLTEINRTFATSIPDESRLSDQLHLKSLDYSLLSSNEIEKQYHLLRLQLCAVNQVAARKVDTLKNVSIRKSHKFQSQSTKIQVSDEELKNNLAIIQRLQDELSSLQVKLSELSVVGKSDYQVEIDSVRKQLLKEKGEIKKLELSAKQKGRSIETSDNIFNVINQLQRTKGQIEQKRRRLSEKSRQVKVQTSSVIAKTKQIQERGSKAELFHSSESQQNRERQSKNENGIKVSHKEEEVLIMRKNIESIVKIKQIKYQKLLFEYKDIVTQIEEKESKIKQKQGQIEDSMKSLSQLQQKYEKIKEKKEQILLNKSSLEKESQNVNIVKQSKQIQNKSKIVKSKIENKKIGESKTIQVSSSTDKPKQRVRNIIRKEVPLKIQEKTLKNQEKSPKKSEENIPLKNQENIPLKSQEQNAYKTLQITPKMNKQRPSQKYKSLQSNNKGQTSNLESNEKEKEVKNQSVEPLPKIFKEKVSQKKENQKKQQVKKGKVEIEDHSEEEYEDGQSDFQDIISSSERSMQKSISNKQQEDFALKVEEEKKKLSSGSKLGMNQQQIDNIESILKDKKVKKNHFSIQL